MVESDAPRYEIGEITCGKHPLTLENRYSAREWAVNDNNDT